MQKADFTQEEYWRNLIESSFSRLLILYILSEGPSYGYMIKKKVGEFSRGLCTVSEGGLYPALAQMERAGLLSMEKRKVLGRKRKVYSITPKAKEALEVGIKTWRQIVALLEAIYRRKQGFRRVRVE